MRLAAVDEVKEGRAFVLSLPLDYPGGEPEEAARKSPKLFAASLGGHQMYNFPLTATDICCDDGVTMWLQYSTQWDSLAHWGRMFDVDGSGVERPVYYNGFRPGEHILGPDEGGPRAERLGIENMAMTGVQGRGVLVDLAREYGTARAPIGYDKLMRTIEAQKVEVRAGDFLLLHTGYGEALMGMRKQPDEAVLHKTGTGLDGADDERLREARDQRVEGRAVGPGAEKKGIGEINTEIFLSL